MKTNLCIAVALLISFHCTSQAALSDNPVPPPTGAALTDQIPQIISVSSVNVQTFEIAGTVSNARVNIQPLTREIKGYRNTYLLLFSAIMIAFMVTVGVM